jgi:hypothetical protein
MASLSLAFDILAKDRASKEFSKVGDSADRAGKKGAAFGKAVGAGMVVAAAAAAKFASSSVKAFVESEQSSARLDAALKTFPATADRSRASFDALNASLAQKTKFDDDATASGQAVLAQFKLTGSQIQSLTPLLQDYAAKTGKDLPTAAQDLGKAVLGQGKALKGVGLNLKDTGSATGNLNQLMGGLRTQVGGFATAEGKTAAGQAAILQNRFGELQEKVGAKLVPILTQLANKLLSVIGFVERNASVIGPLVAVLGGLAAVVVTVNAAARAYAATQAALNIVMAANPIGLVVLAIAALVAGFVIAYKNSETFRNIVQGVFKAVGGAAIKMADVFLAALQGIAHAAGKLPGPLGAPFRAAEDAIKSARGKLDGLSAKLDAVGRKKASPSIALLGVGKVEADLLRLEKRITNIGGVQVRVPARVVGAVARAGGVQERALGGPIVGGRPYLVGERGPELVVPRAGGTVIPAERTATALSGSSTQVVNHFHGVGPDVERAVRTPMRELAFALATS